MKKKKWREIRSAVTMMCVMLAMLSTATYAWFTLTDSPTVTGLEMTAASTSGLKIAKQSTDTFVDAISVADSFASGTVKLTPVSIKDKTANFYTPVYTGNNVNSLSDTALTDLTDYVAHCTYYLKADGDEEVKVGILTANPSTQTGDMGVDSNNRSNITGSFVRTQATTNNGDAFETIKSVRVGLVVDGTMYIYEPNNDEVTNTGTYAINGIPEADTPDADIISAYSTGKITTGAINDYTSKGMFTVGNTAKQVDMYIWIEGTDDDCVNEIMTDVIQAQIQFTVVDEMLTTS